MWGAGAASLVQHGDVVIPEYLQGLNDDVRSLLDRVGTSPFDPSRSLVVCHSAPGFWFTPSTAAPCPPPGSRYFVGRTMFEARAHVAMAV
jgi:hypothetical protein